MVNINEEFASKYLKSADLKGEMVKVKIKDVLIEEIGSDRKMVMYFAGKEKGMVLNKTNAMTVGDACGEDTDDWVGQVIELFSMKVEYQGKMVDGLRVRVPKKKTNPVDDSGFDDDENPAPKADQSKAYAEASGRDPKAYAEELDDEIPF